MRAYVEIDKKGDITVELDLRMSLKRIYSRELLSDSILTRDEVVELTVIDITVMVENDVRKWLKTVYLEGANKEVSGIVGTRRYDDQENKEGYKIPIG